jgi:phage-related protein (TIGR01555 family)
MKRRPINVRRRYPEVGESLEALRPAPTLATLPEGVADSAAQDSKALFSSIPSGGFLGYPALSRMMDNGIVKACITSVVDDMTRNWIEIVREGDEGDSWKLKEIEEGFERFGVRKVLRQVALHIGYFGGCLVFIDTGSLDLETPLNFGSGSGEMVKGALRRFVTVEPVNVCPGFYESSDPLSEDFYKPTSWMIMSRPVHASRVIRAHGPLPSQLLLPSYNFMGIPQAQILWDYVKHFQRDRVSASDMLNKYSTKVLKTNMDAFLNGQMDDGLFNRIRYFAQMADNEGVLAIDKDREDFVKVESMLSGVTDIVQQALELICAVNSTPVVKTLGLSPKGFNATGDIDLRNYYDRISALQEQQMAPVLDVMLRIVQIHLFGEVDGAIGYKFNPLSEEDKQMSATVRKTLADTAVLYLDRGVVSPEEVRQNLIADKDSGYDDVKLEDLPEPPELMPGLGSESGPELGPGASAEAESLPPQQQALSGPQVTSLLEIISAVAEGRLPRSSGVAMITIAFNMPESQAEQVMGQVGQEFFAVPKVA